MTAKPMRALADGKMAGAVEGVTLWRRIADELEHAIRLGSHAVGDRLPGEVEIALRFGVNRHTVRRALAELAARGLVRAERGSGTYVEPVRLAYPIGSRTRFSEIVGRAGRAPEGRLIAHLQEAAPPDIAKRLALAPQAPVIRLNILRGADGVPISFATSWVSADRMPDAARIYRKFHSMTKTLAHFGIRDYRRRKTWIGAALADVVDAQRLNLSPGRPLLLIESIDVAPSGAPVLTSTSRFAADRVDFLVES
jgi:GntR family phosphonate transport system transcriptional regulator